MIVRVSAASRLHFGLLHVPVPGVADDERNPPLRKFGGLGLMVDRPGVVLEVTESNAWRFEGSLAVRAKAFVERMAFKRPLFVNANGPPEHVGLGIGTALGMAIADALSTFEGHPNRTANELASHCGRGERSGIGVSGYRSGGFILDVGKRDGEAISVCQSFPFPEDWRVVIARPHVKSTWSGESERAAFARPRSLDESLANQSRLEKLLCQTILPALASHDFAAFANSLSDYNRIAGEPFVADQGGVYSTPEVANLIGTIKCMKRDSYGQSSWGPSVFAILPSEETAGVRARVLPRTSHGLDSVIVARAAGPARVEVLN